MLKLNIGMNPWTDTHLANAYAAARSTSFKLFISFDFAASPCFSDYTNQIVSRLNLCALRAASVGQWCFGVYLYWSQPLGIIPFYQAALANSDITDGLFQWNAWPSQNNQPIDQTMSIARDQYYQSQLGGSPYMAGVSPWFFTHYDSNTYNKNWLYLSDTLLTDRWNEILNLQPQLVELITWNDFGESHYIGPLHPERTSVYTPSGDSDGAIQWLPASPTTISASRKIIKLYIAAYKNGGPVTISPSDESIVYWYKPHPIPRTSDRAELPRGRCLGCNSSCLATLTRTSGTCSYTTTAPAGINYFATGMGNGQPTFKLVRNGVTITQGIGGLSIDLKSCNMYNFNAFVGSTN
ncbi:glycosyl hydrolase family 71-domain-containing protein [Mycena galopus ATCC 62051]|nr:glycosyl hydrolase family 71-domain-containing protein [Mycena galopus ATCC 62051]